jgi:ABC-2 type transport system ATP-binding protein
MTDTTMLQVTNLTKQYGETRAVDGISFAVPDASVFTILGPNGAGKTTTLEILEGIREPDSGELVLFGQPMTRVSREAKQRMGVLLQDGGFEPHLKVREIIQLFASFFVKSRSVDEILDLVALREKAGAQVRTLSGGQRQRMAVGVALVNDPDVVFLDEPTTGLDPQARRNMWDIVSDLRSRGKTIVLTTHYMEEAEALSDTVCIMDHGKIMAEGSPRELTGKLGEETLIEFRVHESRTEALSELAPCCEHLRRDGLLVTLEASDLQRTMTGLLRWSETQGIPINDLHVRQPNLEDVFLTMTGRTLRE